MKFWILTLLALLSNLVFTLLIQNKQPLNHNQVFGAFFGKLTYPEKHPVTTEIPQTPKQDPNQEFPNTEQEINNKQQGQNKILINDNPYQYVNPFILYCYDKQQKLIREDRCSSQSRCLKLLQQYSKCPGSVAYQEILQ